MVGRTQTLCGLMDAVRSAMGTAAPSWCKAGNDTRLRKLSTMPVHWSFFNIASLFFRGTRLSVFWAAAINGRDLLVPWKQVVIPSFSPRPSCSFTQRSGTGWRHRGAVMPGRKRSKTSTKRGSGVLPLCLKHHNLQDLGTFSNFSKYQTFSKLNWLHSWWSKHLAKTFQMHFRCGRRHDAFLSAPQYKPAIRRRIRPCVPSPLTLIATGSIREELPT